MLDSRSRDPALPDTVGNDNPCDIVYVGVMSKSYWVYILASKKNGTLYIGVTNNLSRRIYEHRIKAKDGFTSQYNVVMLVWSEEHADINEAIAREKSLKRWERAWKLQLIEAANPDWQDLYETLNY